MGINAFGELLGSPLASAADTSRPSLADRGKRRRFPRGTVLMRQGERADAMYLILQGSVRVERMAPALVKPLHLADLGPGQVVGEIGILNGTPRTATVTAITDVLAVQLSRRETLQALQELPGLPVALLKLVSKRLAETDVLVTRVAAEREPFERRWVGGFKVPWPVDLTVILVAHAERRFDQPRRDGGARWPRLAGLLHLGAGAR